jgi:hypothetical protein
VEDKNVWKLLIEESEGKRIPRGRWEVNWEVNIEMCLEGIRWEGVDRINLAHCRDCW